MRLVSIIAIGSKSFGEMALNCALSIKAHDFKQKIALITDGEAIKGIESDVERFFDYKIDVSYSEYPTPQEKAFYTKVNLYDILTKDCPDATEFIAIDADCMMIPSHGVKEWFDQHEGRIFTAWNNDLFDFKEGKSQRTDYTFWCNPLEAQEYYGLENPMPQVNTSFIYFSKAPLAKSLFETAKKIWHDESLAFKTYKGAKPDELCFNIACSLCNVIPHQTPYYPIFFQFATENQREVHIQHYYSALGFAGELLPSELFKSLYHKYAYYYRDMFGVHDFSFVEDEKVTPISFSFVDDAPIDIHPKRIRTLYRQNEISNSGAGIFNPDAIYLDNGDLMEIFRKEKDWDAYGRYKISSAIPHVVINGEKENELITIGFDDNVRLEDFRVFKHGEVVMCNHSIVTNNNLPSIRIGCCLSYIHSNMLCKLYVPNIPIEVGHIQKNWVYFSDGNKIYCIFSLSPYLIFSSDINADKNVWEKVEVSEPNINFIHKSQISNSTNPIKISDTEYLMFFHTKERGVYYKGAVIIDAETKNITHYTPHTIPFNVRNDGMHKGIHYVSGLLLMRGNSEIRVYYGEGDSHSCYAEYDKENLVNAIKSSYGR